MKKLDLNGFGVQEMNAEEMSKTEGGIWILVALAILAGIDYLQDGHFDGHINL